MCKSGAISHDEQGDKSEVVRKALAWIKTLNDFYFYI